VLRRTLLVASGVLAATGALAQRQIDPGNTLILDLPGGRVTIELLPEFAPRHVAHVKTLVRRGFYDNAPFDRVIEGLMAEVGVPTGIGTGSPDRPDLSAEFIPPSRASLERGTVGTVRRGNPNRASSRFFIMLAPAIVLEGQHAIWGRVIAGMEAVDKIKRSVGPNGMIENPDCIRTARISADLC